MQFAIIGAVLAAFVISAGAQNGKINPFEAGCTADTDCAGKTGLVSCNKETGFCVCCPLPKCIRYSGNVPVCIPNKKCTGDSDCDADKFCCPQKKKCLPKNPYDYRQDAPSTIRAPSMAGRTPADPKIKPTQNGCHGDVDCEGRLGLVSCSNNFQCQCCSNCTLFGGSDPVCVEKRACKSNAECADDQYCCLDSHFCFPKNTDDYRAGIGSPGTPGYSGPTPKIQPYKTGCTKASDCEGRTGNVQCVSGQCKCCDTCSLYGVAFPVCYQRKACPLGNECPSDQFCCPSLKTCFPIDIATYRSDPVVATTPKPGVCGPKLTPTSPYTIPRASVGCPSSGKPSALCTYPVSKNEVLNRHNCWRKNVSPAAKTAIPALKWDDMLTTQAEKWAVQCQLAHDTTAARALPNRTTNGVKWNWVGQNLCMSSALMSWSDCIDNWVSETKDFRYGTGSINGNPTGHYTQVVAARSTFVGCAQAYCPGKSMPYFLVCNYGPGGNYGDGTKIPYVSV